MLSMERTRKLEIATASVRKFAQVGSTSRAANLLTKFRAADIVVIVEGLGSTDRLGVWKGLRELDSRLASDVLTEMPDKLATSILTQLSPSDVGAVLRSVPVDDAAHLVSLLPEELVDDLREDEDQEKTISPELAGHLAYAEETAGRLMTTNLLALPEQMTVGEATRSLQERADQFEMVFYLYVVDDRRHLVGVLSLRQLLLNPSSTPLRRIMADDVIRVRTDADQEEVAQMIARYNLLAVPVVDDENRLVGLITVDDAIDVLREEATEDIYALAGVAVEERIGGSPIRSIRLRLPWIYVNLLTATLSVTVIHLFEGTIAEVVALATLMPIASGMGGNAATQALTVVVRGLAMGEMSGTSNARVLAKEVIVGLGLGVGAGLAGALIAAWWFGNPVLGLLLGLALLVNMIVAAVAGTAVPLGLRGLGLDPAAGASVFVTACTDMTGFAAFLGLATMFLSYLK
ncbi:MAG: magnesium transporter [Blastocatellia bacterium]|nr:magnesium transporter [Blastocatellia bacterium]